MARFELVAKRPNDLNLGFCQEGVLLGGRDTMKEKKRSLASFLIEDPFGLRR